ncbi:hypothetical protein PG996_012987 [Apiospora saccharicola]|uniref:CCZ1/INTU/HSP4 first Longin domain-containing protein n=1 Tax=Apiospora saccharicola TaxID=335842 RepID=A0ABR1U478_9PEZI
MGTPVSPPPASVVPAQLGFLAIFNPSLGTTDDTIDDQIVYYASVDAHNSAAPPAAPRRRNRASRNGRPTEALSPEERNERLRQIGLAQGMIEFSRGFAGGKTLDSIETEKSRVVLHELEPGWWILASIDLTKIPLPPRLGSAAKDTFANVEHSSREVKPAALLMQDLLRAHSIFLLHHAASLSALFVRTRRPKFVAMLGRYWDIYLSTWNVMLHGNPACAVYGGIKIAASGELGVGVGEEERGSGEREVLEGFVGRIEGLVDLVVSKFGDTESESISDHNKETKPDASEALKWLGLGEEPGAEDGAVFLGTGALSKNSLRDVVYWMEDLYTWGDAAYGVKESPTSTRTRTKRTRPRASTVDNGTVPQPTTATDQKDTKRGNSQESPAQQSSIHSSEDSDAKGMDKFVNYLKMGYGTHWSLGSSSKTPGPPSEPPSMAPTPPTAPEGNDSAAKESEARPEAARRTSRPVDDTAGHYLIGLQGAVDDVGSDSPESDGSEGETRTLLRTLTVELESEMLNKPEAQLAHDLGSAGHELRLTKSGHRDSMDRESHFDSQDRNKTKRIRVVVYVSKPFIYTFLFENRTDSLAYESLYRSLHHQLAPLRKTLAVSTSYRPGKPDAGNSTPSHIFDLVWDSRALTIHSTIPCIPDHASLVRYQNGEQKQPPFWSRVEAVNTHMQILNTYSATRLDSKELERTCKTSRGWWVVWTRIESKKGGSMTMDAIAEDHEPPHLEIQDSTDTDQTQDSVDSVAVESEQQSCTDADMETARSISVHHHQKDQQERREKHRKHGSQASKEIVLIRRAGENGASRSRSGSLGDAGEWTEGASRLAQGIGIDTRKYIDELLSMGQ